MRNICEFHLFIYVLLFTKIYKALKVIETGNAKYTLSVAFKVDFRLHATLVGYYARELIESSAYQAVT